MAVEKLRENTEISELFSSVEEDYNADVILYFGPLLGNYDDFLIEKIPETIQRKNAILMLTTYGGHANNAYRIASALQDAYRGQEGELILFVNSACASAGTLVALGCDRIIMDEHGELGPLDVQLRKQDEVGERTSGLAPSQAIEYLESLGRKMFQSNFENLRFNRDFPFSTRLAADVACQMTTGMLECLYGQIDPVRLAEVERSTTIAFEYGSRIRTNNVKPETIERLILGYPSHDFTIIRREAEQLFENVDPPNENLAKLGNRLKVLAREYLREAEPLVLPWNVPNETTRKVKNEPKNPTANGGPPPKDNKRGNSAKGSRAKRGR